MLTATLNPEKSQNITEKKFLGICNGYSNKRLNSAFRFRKVNCIQKYMRRLPNPLTVSQDLENVTCSIWVSAYCRRYTLTNPFQSLTKADPNYCPCINSPHPPTLPVTRPTKCTLILLFCSTDSRAIIFIKHSSLSDRVIIAALIRGSTMCWTDASFA